MNLSFFSGILLPIHVFLILNFFVMKRKNETLRQIVQLMDMQNLSLSDVENFKKGYYRNVARRWLCTRHQPGWFINNDGASADNLEELDIHDPEFEHFGIWLNDDIIVSSRIMYELGSYAEAEKFISGTSLGPFYFRLPSREEQYLLPGQLQVVSDALVRCGLSEIPEGIFWAADKIQHDGKDLYSVYNAKKNLAVYSEPDEKHLGLYILNVG